MKIPRGRSVECKRVSVKMPRGLVGADVRVSMKICRGRQGGCTNFNENA